jgi:diguanylate cyclase (GGDEF)-like protein
MRSDKTYSLLLIDTNITDCEQIEALLGKIPGTAYQLHCVHGIEDGERAILESANAPFDLCLVKHPLGGHSGIEFISSHQGDGDYPPMVLVTDQADAATDQAAVEAGAIDYLHKSDLTPNLLERAIRYSVSQHRLKNELLQLSTTDPVTGVLNRRMLYDLGNREFDRATRYGHDLSLLLMDLDHLRDINDTFGQETGNKLLFTLVTAILSVIRETDSFGRFGGSEFLLILPHTNLGGARKLAERIREAMKNHPVTHAGRLVETSLNCGLCELSAGIEFFDELVVCADLSRSRERNGRETSPPHANATADLAAR